MNQFQYQERRRFFRVKTCLPFHFIQSFDNIDQMKRSFIDFFSDDVGYVSYCFEDYVAQRKNSFELDVTELLSDKPEHKAVEEALWSLSKKIKLLEKALLMISGGKSPQKDRMFMMQYRQLCQPLDTTSIIGNKRTKYIINKFDEKTLYFLKIVDRVAENSSFEEIYSEEFIRDFDIEYEMMALKRVSRVSKSNLANLFVYLYEHLDEIIRVFNDVINGRTIVNKPHLWSQRDIKISAGGIGFKTTYKLQENMILDVFLSLEGAKDKDGKPMLIRQKVKVIHMIENKDHYYVGTMFLGLKSKMIDILNSYIFSVEVDDSMAFIKNLPDAELSDFNFLDMDSELDKSF